MGKIKETYQRFKKWQLQPYQVKPLSEETHDCPTCGTHYQGNYCPRCGQSASVSRYSFKMAFLLFLDVWGLGNRGMFRTLRDLILRPGYMIRDYLGGMQMAYFPPFKMYFLLITLSLLVDTGFNIKNINRIKQQQEQFDKNLALSIEENKDADKQVAPLDSIKQNMSPEDLEKAQKIKDVGGRFIIRGLEIAKDTMQWIFSHISIVTLLWLLVFSGPLYLMFRHSPKIPDMRYSEFFVAMVYTTNMLTMYSIVTSFFDVMSLEFFSYIITVFPLKQLSGYTYKRTILNIVAAIFMVAMLSVLIFIIGITVGALMFAN